MAGNNPWSREISNCDIQPQGWRLAVDKVHLQDRAGRYNNEPEK